MARLIIDLQPAKVSWAGSWWEASWGGLKFCTRRDPAHDIARTFLRAGKAASDDTIVVRYDGKVIDEEQIGEAAKRKANPDRISTRLILAAAAAEVGDGNHGQSQPDGAPIP